MDRRRRQAVLEKWNESEVYAKTVAYFATRLAKEP
jgi:membrane-bound lytic murein transglycosylase B